MVGFLISTAASVMMNGVCCVYQMHEERHLREAMRKDIREEWKLQRKREFRAERRYQKQYEKFRLQASLQRFQAMKSCRTSPRTSKHNESSFVEKYGDTVKKDDEGDLSLAYSMDSMASLFDEELQEDVIEGNPQSGC